MINNMDGKTLIAKKDYMGIKKGQRVYCEYHHMQEKHVCVSNMFNCPLTHPMHNWYPDHIFEEEIP